MEKINCLIVDDEEPARNLVENYAIRLPYLNITGKCATPLEAIQILQDNSVDLMFLDIQMPELTGVEFLRTLQQKPLVIFTTAYQEYALEGYELDVVDYLLKPFRFERFLQAVNKAMKMLKLEDKENHRTLNLSGLAKEERNFELVKADFKVFRVFHDDILYIESMKEYVAYHTVKGRIISLGSLKRLEKELPPDKFMRVHKSFIIAIAKAAALEGNLIHIGEVKIPVGTSYRTRVLKELF